jgi:hypothetical protein
MTHALAVDQLQGTPDPVTRIIEPHIADARLQGRRPEADADVGNLLICIQDLTVEFRQRPLLLLSKGRWDVSRGAKDSYN